MQCAQETYSENVRAEKCSVDTVTS